MNDYPKTKSEWWALAQEHADNLREIVLTYHPAIKFSYVDDLFEVTAPNAQAACNFVSDQIVKENDGCPVEKFDRYLLDSDPEMAIILNQAWFGIPESTRCWPVPSFGVLCDLCSEAYVLEEEQ